MNLRFLFPLCALLASSAQVSLAASDSDSCCNISCEGRVDVDLQQCHCNRLITCMGTAADAPSPIEVTKTLAGFDECARIKDGKDDFSSCLSLNNGYNSMQKIIDALWRVLEDERQYPFKSMKISSMRSALMVLVRDHPQSSDLIMMELYAMDEKYPKMKRMDESDETDLTPKFQ
eukprot:GDKI01012631.1.p1 GENE.GDKI01012631.1~~GDKI01012631.1.p1  ORF type:complete len:175 (-),score=39.78 GDKI01012631.1:394-918(-)